MKPETFWNRGMPGSAFRRAIAGWTMVLCAVGPACPAPSDPPVREPPAVEAAFSPGAGRGALRALLAREIRGVHDAIDVALYTGMTAGTARELARVVRRGRVRVLVDGDALRLDPEGKPRSATEREGSPRWRAILTDAGIPVRAMPVTGEGDKRPAFHHKFAVIDGTTVLTGSWNWSAKGDGINYENLVVIRDAGLADRFAVEFERLWRKAGDPPKRSARERRGHKP